MTDRGIQRHPALSAYLATNRIDVPDRPDGVVVLVFDSLYRLYLLPAQRGDLVMESRLTSMPPGTREQDELIDLALSSVAERLATQREAIALSEDGQRLLLQQCIPGNASLGEFESSLESFINAIADWRLILRVN
ncbi:CesT family type III secretion system chaperone [Lacisediminimonas sp.]|uniref:CesT family type III secretion system chaperone n=1 Tax=Lacisediminimonas sp. TaxID=3060582 RepID=UPI00271AEBB7|nr:CesT family type III secretion system chaperone [Lacisediminimonas sp.]MDO8301087.1 CesT family type III secretion system chaperone [Lacisediminimonas sp.]MDO9219110.1 CesT family type III secretion system chaperone [Lacisediminimonas sp.]